MGNEDEIIKRLDELSRMVGNGFKEVNGAISDLEWRIDKQEKKIRRTTKEQSLQASEIEKLKKVVNDLADSDAVWGRGRETAIRKEPAYKGFEAVGVGKRVALRALRDAGTIKADSENTNTCVVKINGRAERVIIVLGE